MSGVASGITKVFTTLGSGAARLGSAVKGVGASLFTGAAASGAPIAGGGLSSLFGSGTLGKIFSGVTKVMGGGPGAAIGAMAGAPAAAGAAATRGFGSVVPGAIDTGTTAALTAADTATGLAPTGVSGATQGGGGWLNGFGNFLGSDKGMELLTNVAGGVGENLTIQGQLDAAAERDRENNRFLAGERQKIVESYNGMPGEKPLAPDPTRRPTPAVAYARGDRVEYDPVDGRIKRVAA